MLLVHGILAKRAPPCQISVAFGCDLDVLLDGGDALLESRNAIVVGSGARRLERRSLRRFSVVLENALA